MNSLKLGMAFLLVGLLAGCASGLTVSQNQAYDAFEREGVLVMEKEPGTGAALGILPGGGSFYAREPGLGVVNLLFWPLSILWDPISGYEGAKAINYHATVYEQKKKRQKELELLNEKLVMKTIDNELYIIEKSKIDSKYGYLDL